MLYNSRVGVVFSICLSIVLTNTLLTSIHEGGEASPYLVVILSSDVIETLQCSPLSAEHGQGAWNPAQ